MNRYNRFNILRSKTKPKQANTKSNCTIALVGNPNSGKTTLFNALTGSNQKVGNWPGVTVEQKIGAYKKDTAVAIVDTPGIYSLSPFTPEEQIARSYLTEGKPNLIINVVDSTNLERNLYLTTQLLELGIPVVVALNMKDEAKAKGIVIDEQQLGEQFGCQFTSISASKNVGVGELMNICKQTLVSPTTAKHAGHSKLTTAEERYVFISEVLAKARKVDEKVASKSNTLTLTERIDRVVLNKWLAFPIFALVMTAVFYLSIGSVGGFLADLINERLTPALQLVVTGWLASANLPWLTSLVVDGVIGGVMSVVGFVPQIMLLFGCIAVLEASGYMSRIAFITDRLLSRIGLGGRSFVSMILGCGCSVPAIMATRTIKNAKERETTITLTPFMPCSAKLAVISFFTTRILGGNALYAISFYFLSILSVIAGGLVLKLFARNKSDADDTFLMELPPYRAPTATSVLKQMWERGKAFLYKAGTVIFVASVTLWCLTNFNFRFEAVDAGNSMLASIGKLLAPLFTPLGFNDGGCGWQFSVATLVGIAAKESVVTTLQILLPQGVEGAISGLGAYSFVAYNLLTVPCVATISASFAEQGKLVKGVKSAAFQIVTAYTVSLIIYQLGSLFKRHPAAFAIVLTAIALTAGLFVSAKYLVRRRTANGACQGCANCSHQTSCKKQK